MRCESDIVDRWYHKRQRQKCQNKAAVEIDGQKLCRRHAGTTALRMIIEQKKAKMLDENMTVSELQAENARLRSLLEKNGVKAT